MDDELDDFLAHYGVKGMKWGQRRTDAQIAKASGEAAPKRKIDKKKVAIAAGVIAGTAAVTIAVVMINKNKSAAGEAFVADQMKKMSGQASWDVITKVSTSPKTVAPTNTKLSRKELDDRVTALKVKVGEDAAKKQIQAFASKSMWDIMNDPAPAAKPSGSASVATKSSGFQTPSQKRKTGEAAAAAQIKTFASRSMWDLASDTSIQPKTTSYSTKAKKADTKLYGAKNAAQIAKKVSKGGSLADARKTAALKSYGPTVAKAVVKSGQAPTVAKVAANVSSGKRKDKRR